MLVSQLSMLATAASAAAIQRRAASITPIFEVSDFTAQHNPNGPDETIQFTVASSNTGLESTDCGIYGYQCQHTDFLLCDIPVIGECTSKNVTFSFNKDTKSEKWGIAISYQAPARFYSGEHQFPRRQDTFYEYDGAEYEHIAVPGGAFSFSNAPTYALSKRQIDRPTYEVIDFDAQHNPHSADETIVFTIESKNFGIPTTYCEISGYVCQHTDNLLCDIPPPVVGTCSNKAVTFGFSEDLKNHLKYLEVYYQRSSSEPKFTSRHYFPKEQDNFYEYDSAEYEQIKLPAFTFKN